MLRQDKKGPAKSNRSGELIRESPESLRCMGTEREAFSNRNASTSVWNRPQQSSRINPLLRPRSSKRIQPPTSGGTISASVVLPKESSILSREPAAYIYPPRASPPPLGSSRSVSTLAWLLTGTGAGLVNAKSECNTCGAEFSGSSKRELIPARAAQVNGKIYADVLSINQAKMELSQRFQGLFEFFAAVFQILGLLKP
ncbi:uncharacterized protein BDR25DRAFT_353990 [Lindgomyces ingoldianus]|uniref:Uncharacterized protein n=1 Tax=Lindgomyces ingoldianus TaxID=673940 RepID=A0ACB6R1T4_9PLEO|nr:uncharacterized protein BDR25DRAFT_353990 [Lindgomyces ingoldianus]KAF2472297.1 hypothetical protein BDR25DRAFT_353990 [Lindgomyces ingoldianus]